MADSLPASFMEEIRRLRLDIATLKGANQLLSSSITGGLFQVYDDNGKRILIVGTDTDARTKFAVYADTGQRLIQAGNISAGLSFDNGPGFMVQGKNGHVMFMSNESGMIAPYINWPLLPAPELTTAERIVVTSGTFINRAYYSKVRFVSADALLTQIVIAADVGTVAEVKWVTTTTGSTTSTLVHTGTGNINEVLCLWQHGVTLGNADEFKLQVRRASGAGNVYVYRPTNFYFSSKEFLSATTGGW